MLSTKLLILEFLFAQNLLHFARFFVFTSVMIHWYFGSAASMLSAAAAITVNSVSGAGTI